MRMRKKKHLAERMSACEKYLIQEPVQLKGKWREHFNANPTAKLYLEIGCGKGKFIREKSVQSPNDCFIAMEKISDVIVMAMEKTKEAEIANVCFMNKDAKFLTDYFNENELDGIFLNFSDPWKKRDQHDRRLTYKTFLELYKTVLKPDGWIAFKSDNKELFDFSVKSFKDNGFEIVEISYDLHNSEFAPDNIMTEYETNFSQKGFNINYLKAIKSYNIK